MTYKLRKCISGAVGDYIFRSKTNVHTYLLTDQDWPKKNLFDTDNTWDSLGSTYCLSVSHKWIPSVTCMSSGK